jgi:MFS family permease
VVGLFFILLGTAAIALTVESGPVFAIAIAIGLTGIGLGAINNPVIQRIIAIVPEAEKHMAGTSVQTIRNIGISFGAAFSGLVAAVAGLSEGASRETVGGAMQWVYGVNAGCALLALVMVIPLLLARRAQRRQKAT